MGKDIWVIELGRESRGSLNDPVMANSLIQFGNLSSLQLLLREGEKETEVVILSLITNLEISCNRRLLDITEQL
jgi:hypothetical protein